MSTILPAIETILVLSTAHITEGEAKDIELELALGPLSGFSREYGYMLHVSSNQLLIAEQQGWNNVRELLSAARYAGYNWLMFDRDAEIITGYPTFDW